MSARKLILSQGQRAPGDAVVFSSVVRDCKLAHPDILLDVRTNYREVYDNNPYLTPIRDDEGELMMLRASVGIGESKDNGSSEHYINTFHLRLQSLTGLEIKLTAPKPDLHLADDELSGLFPFRYWCITGGFKGHQTTKAFSFDKYQAVVDELTRRGIQLVQIGWTQDPNFRHFHPALSGTAANLVDKTDLRQLFRVIAHSDGVISPISLPMHVAAAFEKPAVVIAGGREAPSWEAYSNGYGAFSPYGLSVRVPHRFLHTVGRLDCCVPGGCWRTWVEPPQSVIFTPASKELCCYPTPTSRWPVAKCMDLVSADDVIQAVWSYYDDGTLPKLTPSV